MDHPSVAFAYLNGIAKPRRTSIRITRAGFWARLFGF